MNKAKMNSLCAFCLSKDRNLSFVSNQQLFTLYYCLNTEDAQYVKQLQTECQLLVCWECRTRLTNFSTFVKRAAESVNILKSHLHGSTKPLPPSASSLLTTQVELIDFLQPPSDNTLIHEDKVPTQCNIKLEREIEKEPLKEAIKSEDILDEDNYIDLDDLIIPCQSGSEGRDIVEASDLPDCPPNKTVKKVKGKAKSKTAKKSKIKKKPPPKCSVVWVTQDVAQSWYSAERDQDSPTHASLCQQCQGRFRDEDELQMHLQTHHDESAGKYTCNICQYRFSDQSSLKRHIEAHYLLYKCNECSYESRVLSEMQAHSRTEHGDDVKPKRRTKEDNNKAQKCKRCKNVFANMVSLRKHRAKCSTYKCEQCDKSFKYNPSYYEHLKTHRSDAAEALIYCAGCETHFKSAKWYKQHFHKSLKHVSRDAFKHECQYCGMKFLTPRRLREHVGSIHLKKGIYECEMCPKSYMSKGMFARHRAAQHELGRVDKARDKVCHVCGKAFTSNHLLNNHMRSHTGEKPFRCTFCDATFAQSGTLYTHSKVVHSKRLTKRGATDTDRYRCSACDKEFGTDAKRRAHFDYYHLKNAKFACAVCDKNFISSTSLKNHNATRHGVPTTRSYCCEHCGKKFTTASARCQHVKTHSAARSLQCRECDAAFRNTGALYMHYKLKHLKLKRGDRVRIKNLCRSAEEIVVSRDP